MVAVEIVAGQDMTVGARHKIVAVAVVLAGTVAVLVAAGTVAAGTVAAVGKTVVGNRPVLVAAAVGLRDMLDSEQSLGQVLNLDQEVMHCHQSQLYGHLEDRSPMLLSVPHLASRTHWLSCCHVVHYCSGFGLGRLGVDSHSLESLDLVRKL